MARNERHERECGKIVVAETRSHRAFARGHPVLPLIGLPHYWYALRTYPFAARPLFADPPGSIVPRGEGAGNNAAPCSSIRRHNRRAGLFFNWITAHDECARLPCARSLKNDREKRSTIPVRSRGYSTD